MKSAIITIVTIAASALGLIAVSEINAKGRKAVVSDAKKKIENERSEADANVFTEYEAKKNASKRIEQEEAINVLNKVGEYKKSVNYDERKKELDNYADKKVAEFKDSIHYNDTRNEYKKEYDELLSGWKKDNTFVERIGKEKDRISEVEKISQNQEFMTKLVGDNSEFSKESTEKITETIKEAKNDAIKDAKSNIKAIEKEFEDFKKGVKKDYDAKLSDLAGKVNAVREEAVKESSSKLKELEKDVFEKKTQYEEEIRSLRSEETNKLFTDVKVLEETTKQIKLVEKEKLTTALENVVPSDVVAAYFKSVKFGKIPTSMVLSLPLMPIIFVMYSYGKFVFKVISKI